MPTVYTITYGSVTGSRDSDEILGLVWMIIITTIFMYFGYKRIMQYSETIGEEESLNIKIKRMEDLYNSSLKINRRDNVELLMNCKKYLYQIKA